MALTTESVLTFLHTWKQGMGPGARYECITVRTLTYTIKLCDMLFPSSRQRPKKDNSDQMFSNLIVVLAFLSLLFAYFQFNSLKCQWVSQRQERFFDMPYHCLSTYLKVHTFNFFGNLISNKQVEHIREVPTCAKYFLVQRRNSKQNLVNVYPKYSVQP